MDDERKDYNNNEDIIESTDIVLKENEEDTNYTYTYEREMKKKKREKPIRQRIFSYIAIALISSIIGGGLSSYFVLNYVDKDSAENTTQSNILYYLADLASSGEEVDTITYVAQSAIKSVVGITTKSVQQFGFFQQEVSGVGSGVIVDSNGYILTNSHVIDNGDAETIKVLFDDGEEKDAEVLWYDSVLDLAVIKVDAENLPAAKLGDSDELLVGQTAIAIGNPLGLEFQSTVTAGIISGLHRSITVDNNVIEDLIQTDASINEGNSGGPLLNSKGEVVGINTAKITSGEGLGFAIPINTAKPIIEQIIENGNYKTVFMGIKGIEVEIYERQLGVDLSVDEGVIILEVEADSPADEAGLKFGDVITKIDDEEIEDMSQLKKALYNYEQGDKATLQIYRNGREQTVEIEFSQVR